MKIIKLLLLCTFATILYANAEELPYAHQITAACCSSLGALDYGPIKTGSTSVQLGEKSDVFDFSESGKSHFRAFLLPDTQKPLVIKVRSGIFQAEQAPQAWGAFFPAIMVLDQDKNILTTTVDWGGDPVIHRAGFFSTTTDYIEATIDLSLYPSARYMIIYTDGSQVGHAENNAQYLASSEFAGGIFIPHPPSHMLSIMRSSVARDVLSVEISH